MVFWWVVCGLTEASRVGGGGWGKELGDVLPGWARPDMDLILSFTEGVWAVASHPGAAAMHPEKEASAVCAHHLSCTGWGG